MNSNLTKSSLIFVLSFLCFQSFGQTEEPKTLNPEKKYISEDSIYQFVEEPAQFPEGVSAFNNFVKENLRYPEIARKKKIQGTCYLQFMVSKSGEISNVRLKKGVPDCIECDTEAIRLVKSMPNWIPGKMNFENVTSVFSLPIVFKL